VRCASRAMTVMLRLEPLSLNGEGPKGLEGTVRQLTFAGTTVVYLVEVAGVELLVTELGTTAMSP
jgi:hypothetical protein